MSTLGAATVKPAASAIPRQPPATTKPRRLNYREQQEWEQMEAAILAAEKAVADRQADVDRNAGAGHLALAEACRALEDAQRNVEQLYARWQELEGKRS